MRSNRYFALIMVVIALLVIALAMRAGAHEEEDCVTALEKWTEEADNWLSRALMLELRGLRLQCSDVLDDQLGRNHYYGPETERWRALVGLYWPPDLVDRALCLIRYESTGKATATNSRSGAAGLFQIMPWWWDEGLPSEYRGEAHDPATNVRAAYYIYERQGWHAWSVVVSGKC